MTQLILPGYDTEVPGLIYSRNVNAEYPNKDPLALKDVILISRFYQLWNTRTIKRITECAAETLKNRKPFEERSNLEMILSTLTDSRLRSMIKGHGVMEQVLDGLPIEGYYEEKDMQYFLFLQKGYIPKEMIQLNAQNKITTDFKWYMKAFDEETLLNQHLGIQYSIRITLENERLPRKKEMDILSKHEVSKSNTLWIEGGSNTDEIKETLNMISKVFAHQRNINLVNDRTGINTEDNAVEVLEGVLRKPFSSAILPKKSKKPLETYQGQLIN